MDSDRIVGAAKTTGGKLEGAVGGALGDAKTQAEGTIEQVKGKAQEVYGQAKDTVKQYTDTAYDAAGDAYEQGRRYVEEGRRRYPEAERYYREGSRAVTKQVEESPLAAILIAGAVGYILALLVHGRR